MKTKLIFIHGLFGSATEWTGISESFQDDYDVICLTLPGHGRIPLKKRLYSVAELSRFVFENTSSFGPSHFVGYSLGGRVLLELFKNHPSLFRSLILVSSSPGLKSGNEKKERLIQDKNWHSDFIKLSPKVFFHKWYGQRLFGNLYRLPLFEALVNQRILDFNKELGQVLVDCSPANSESMWSVLKRIPNALYIAGEDDDKYAALTHSVVAEAPNFKLEVVSNAGHAVHLERPLEFVKIVKNHISRS